MTDCIRESTTQHHCGFLRGFGPVADDETVVFAVFENTAHDPVDKAVLDGAFDRQQLHKGEHSIARLPYTTRHVFLNRVVKSGVPSKGALIGLVRAQVDVIRDLRFERPDRKGTLERAVCVIDSVEKDNFDGHAVLQYAEAVGGLSEGSKAKVRKKINLELATIFGEIVTLQDLHWPDWWTVMQRHMWTIGNAIAKALLPLIVSKK